jgi:hypothetical protein
MLINDEKALTEDQILKGFIELIKENGAVKFDSNDIRLSDRSVIDFTYRRITGRKLLAVLDNYDNGLIIENENISFSKYGGNLTYSYASGKKQSELDVINQFIELVKQNKKIIFNNSNPSSSPLIDNFMKETDLTDIDFGFLLEEYNDLIRKDILLIERDNVRRYFI